MGSCVTLVCMAVDSAINSGAPHARDLYTNEAPPPTRWLSFGQKVLLIAVLTAMALGLMMSPTDSSLGGGSAGGQDPLAWSSVVYKFSFGCLMGLLCGYAIRSFLTQALVFCAAFSLLVYSLSYTGFLTIEWASMDQAFTGVLGGIEEQAMGFRSFVSGTVPAAALALFGLYVGFRKVD